MNTSEPEMLVQLREYFLICRELLHVIEAEAALKRSRTDDFGETALLKRDLLERLQEATNKLRRHHAALRKNGIPDEAGAGALWKETQGLLRKIQTLDHNSHSLEFLASGGRRSLWNIKPWRAPAKHSRRFHH
jgi:hypothetical protein